VLSRRDLSANNDETQSHLDYHTAKTPRDFMHDLQTRSRIEKTKDRLPRGQSNKSKEEQQRVMSDPRKNGYDTNGSPSALYH
jgi:hypothetical protein